LFVERLQKILSQAGVASRRASEQLMLDGRVTVNGAAIRELGTKADPATDDIRVDGRRITLPERHRYLLLNKPRGFVTTRSDPQRRPTIIDLLGGIREYVYPVGRLDFDTEGLLILTNDGDLAARLTHPRHGVARVYEATVLGIPDTHDLDRLARGVTVEGQRMTAADVHLVPGRRDRHAVLKITLREGRNRQVRTMLDAIGHPVDHLKRIAIGPIRDHSLKPGRWRDLTESEVAALKKAAAYESKSAPAKRREPHRGPPPHEEQGRRESPGRAGGQDRRKRPTDRQVRRPGQKGRPKGRPRRQR
jgi:23S rRNA pseudouridine2605 synthase